VSDALARIEMKCSAGGSREARTNELNALDSTQTHTHTYTQIIYIKYIYILIAKNGMSDSIINFIQAKNVDVNISAR